MENEVTSPPFLQKNAQSLCTRLVRYSAKSTITVEGRVVQFPSAICFIAAASTSGSAYPRIFGPYAHI